MAMEINQVSASDLLAIRVLPQGRAGVWFLNWNFSAFPVLKRGVQGASAFAGAGIYALCFDDELIYIGSFLGNGDNGANFAGDVVSSRWWTHIGAITARGHRLHIARRSLSTLARELGSQDILVDGFLKAKDREKLHADDGNLSPLRRLQFAAQHSQDFFAPNADPTEVLGRFTFVYARLKDLPEGYSSIALQSHIEASEQELINRFAPVCNTMHVPRGMNPERVTLSKVADLLAESLHRFP